MKLGLITTWSGAWYWSSFTTYVARYSSQG